MTRLLTHLLAPIFEDYGLNSIVCRCFGLIPTVVAFLPVALGLLARAIRSRRDEEADDDRGASIPMRVLYALCAVVVLLNIANAFFCVFTEADYDGGIIYYGRLSGGQPEGFGHYYDSSHNLLYIGNMASGHRSGFGRSYEVAHEGSTELSYLYYEGGFFNGSLDGEGTRYDYLDGDVVEVYSGTFLQGYRCGSGTAHVYEERSDGSGYYLSEVYEGGWAFGNRSGFGQLGWYGEDGVQTALYRGTFSDDKLTGWAVYEYTSKGDDHMLFYGEMLDGAFRRGVFYYPDGNMYLQGRLDDEGSWQEEDLVDKWPFPGCELW